MNIPTQLKPLSEKGESFIRESALAYANLGTSSGEKMNDEIAWNYFNGIIDEDKFKYLTDFGDDFKLPVKIRRISIQRPPLNLLLSQMSRRYFGFSVSVSDSASVKEKFKNKFMYMVKYYMNKVKVQRNQLLVEYKRLEQMQQEIMSRLEKEPESEEEMQQQQELRMQLPEIETSIQHIKEEFDERLKLSDDELQRLSQLLTYDYKDIKEILAQKTTQKIKEEYRFSDEQLYHFTSSLVTGKGYYYVDFNPGSKRLDFQAIDSIQLYHPAIPGIRYTQDLPWIVWEDYISFEMAIDHYGGSKELQDKETLQKLEYYRTYSTGKEVGQPNANVYTGSRYSGGISRKRIWWRSPRKVYVKYSPNKHNEGDYFRHFINDENVYDVKPDVAKGEKVKIYYINDLFTAIVLDNKYVVEGRRIVKPLRHFDRWSKVQLPIIGKAFAGHTDVPYSLIWSTKDIQDLHDIVNFHEELYIAASGVKGQIVDLSQKPGTMSPQEQAMHRKLGTLYIETVDKSTKRPISHFNQWQSYDDSLTASIQYLQAIKMALKEACRETMGVSRQRMGEIVGSDQVGTSEMSRDQSALITEILFYEADKISGMALERALNLMAQFKWKDEDIIQITNPDFTTEIVKIPANLLNKAMYDILVLNNTSDEQKMAELKLLLKEQSDKGFIPFKHMVQSYNKESVIELQKAILKWSDEAERLMELRAQNAQQAEKEAEQAKIQMEKEFDMLIEKDKIHMEQMKLEIEQAKLEVDRIQKQAELLLKDKEIEVKKEIELLKLVSNRDVEMNYLEEQSRNNQAQEKLQLLQLQLNKLQVEINASLQAYDEKVKLAGIKSKEKIEQSKMRDKNRIKN